MMNLYWFHIIPRIPAVVGLEKITERLKNGQLVRVDGSSGVVEILE